MKVRGVSGGGVGPIDKSMLTVWTTWVGVLAGYGLERDSAKCGAASKISQFVNMCHGVGCEIERLQRRHGRHPVQLTHVIVREHECLNGFEFRQLLHPRELVMRQIQEGDIEAE